MYDWEQPCIKEESFHGCHGLDGRDRQEGEVQSEDLNVADLLIYSASAPLIIYGNVLHDDQDT